MPIIKKPNQHFDATLYTGNGGTQSVTNAGGFQPDFVWIKDRSNGTNYHALFDVIRGTNNRLFSNATDAQNTTTGTLTAFNSNGFTLGSQEGQNANGNSLVAWQWKAGGASTVNTSGSISSNVSVNTTAGFSVVTYTGTGTTSATVGHGLGVAPKLYITKERTATGTDSYWGVYNTITNQKMFLNATTAGDDGTAGGTNGGMTTDLVTSTTLGIKGGSSSATNINNSGSNYLVYCFAEVEGYSKFGSYTGNGSANGPFVYTGFLPKYILIKRTDTTASWVVMDTSRGLYNASYYYLLPNLSDADSGPIAMDFLSNGFKMRLSNAPFNASGGTYIYMAFAEAPFKFSNAR